MFLIQSCTQPTDSSMRLTDKMAISGYDEDNAESLISATASSRDFWVKGKFWHLILFLSI